MLKQFQEISLDDSNLNRFQKNVVDAFKPLLSLPILDGVLIKNIVFTSNQDNTIAHGLGRNYAGWFVIDKNNFGDVKRSDTQNTSLNLKLILVSSNDMIASIYVF